MKHKKNFTNNNNSRDRKKSYSSDTVFVPGLRVAVRENDFNFAKLVHRSNTLSKFIAGRFPQPFYAIPSARSAQNIPAVLADLVLGRIHGKPSIRLANADITPFPLFACVNHRGAKIERIKQNGDIEFARYLCIKNHFPRQFCEFLKRNIKGFGMFLFDIQPGAQRYGYASVKQTCFDNCMAHAILSGSMVVDLTDRLHFLGSLDRLSVIDNQQTVVASLSIKPLEQKNRLCRNNSPLVKFASPEKLAVIGSMSTVSQELDQPVKGTAVTNADGKNEIAIISIHVSRNRVVGRSKKSFDFLRNSADSKHKASLPVNVGLHYIYRLERPFLLKLHYHQNSFNRSV